MPGGAVLENLARDLKFSIRMMSRSLGFSIVSILTLSLAIAANAVAFGIMNALVLRPLNLSKSDSLYGIEHGNDYGYQSYPNYLNLCDRNRSFADLAAFNISSAGLETGNDPSTVSVYETSGNYFDVLGVQPFLGRVFHGADEHGRNSVPYIVLTYPYWHSHFHDDRSVIGRIVRLNKHPFTIIGVAAPDFHGTLLFYSPDLLVPIVNQPMVDGVDLLDARGNRWIFELVGHLKPGVTPDQAVADLNTIGAYLQMTYPKDVDGASYALGRPSLYGSLLGRPVLAFVLGLMMLAGLILIAACANLGSLFAARAADRSQEVGLRLALGATPKRILRQFMTEALLIAFLGGAAGLSLSIVVLHRLSMWQPFPRTPISISVNPDVRVCAVALIVAVISGILFGIVPTRQVLRADPYEILKSGWIDRIGRRLTVRDVLLAFQIAVCTILVTASLVAVRGLSRSLNADFGFEPRNAMLVLTNLSMAGYSGDHVPEMQTRMIRELETIPGVEAVGSVNHPPLCMGGVRANVFKDETRNLSASNSAAMPYKFSVSPGYFQSAQTSVMAGRTFSLNDDKASVPVAIVNREFAATILGSVTNAVGRYFKLQDGTRIQVVGVVENGRYLNIVEEQQPAMFLPFLQSQVSETWLVIRSAQDPQQLAEAIRSKLRQLDAGLPFEIDTWSGVLDGALFASRVGAVSLGVLGAMASALVITGIFGMSTYSVGKRRRELSVRIAIGVSRSNVLKAALGRPLKLMAFGSTVGLLIGLLATNVLSHIIYQATPRDPLVMIGVVLAMMLLALIATWIPAQHALSVDPRILLREE
jgi:predicted permease